MGKVLEWLESKKLVLYGVAFISMVIKFLLPQSGNLVLLDECMGIVVVFTVILLILVKAHELRDLKVMWIVVARWLVVVACIVVSIWKVATFGMDIVNGTTVMELQECTISKFQGTSGVISLHYKLSGIDTEGNRRTYEIGSKEYTQYNGVNHITIEYYPYTGRIKKLCISSN